MRSLNLAALREAVAAGSIEWRKHVLQKLAERGIAQADVRTVLLTRTHSGIWRRQTVSQRALFGLSCRQTVARRGGVR